MTFVMSQRIGLPADPYTTKIAQGSKQWCVRSTLVTLGTDPAIGPLEPVRLAGAAGSVNVQAYIRQEK